MNWLSIARTVFELLYFTSGIAVAVAAFKGLGQLKVGLNQVKIGLDQLKTTREIASTGARREAVKLAAEQCRYFAETAVPLRSKFIEEYNKAGWHFMSTAQLPGQPSFSLQNCEIAQHFFDLKALQAEFHVGGNGIILFLNALEAFAIPFVAGVADEEIGYQETAPAFCGSVIESMPAIFHLRTTTGVRFESAVRLFALWNNRTMATAMAPMIGALGDWVKIAGKEKIKPIEPSFD
jgi:hypothetical protein